MLKIITTLTVCLLVTLSSFAQKPAPVKFGDILSDVVKMKVYPKDSLCSSDYATSRALPCGGLQ